MVASSASNRTHDGDGVASPQCLWMEVVGWIDVLVAYCWLMERLGLFFSPFTPNPLRGFFGCRCLGGWGLGVVLSMHRLKGVTNLNSSTLSPPLEGCRGG